MDSKIQGRLDAFFTKFKHLKYKKREILVRSGDSPPGIFYIKEGYVKEYAILRKGDELVVNVFKPAVFFPMSWAINDTQNQYFYEAITDLDVWRAPKEEVIEFIKVNPDVLYNLVSRAFKGMDGVLMRMIYLMSGHAYARLISELIITAKRFGENRQNSKVAIQISEKDLAAHSGMTRETVSREIKLLKNKGLISSAKKIIVINDLQKMEEELSECI